MFLNKKNEKTNGTTSRFLKWHVTRLCCVMKSVIALYKVCTAERGKLAAAGWTCSW